MLKILTSVRNDLRHEYIFDLGRVILVKFLIIKQERIVQMKNILRLYTIISISLLFVNKVSANVDLTVKSLTTQNEYVTTYSGSEYLQGTLEIGITTDENINYVQMGMNHYNSMGLGLPYGGLVEQYDFSMSSLSGATIYGYHNMFPQEYYIPAGTTDETLMYIPILISENNDEEFCIQYPDFKDLEGLSLIHISEPTRPY